MNLYFTLLLFSVSVDQNNLSCTIPKGLFQVVIGLCIYLTKSLRLERQ